jgi:hypothetical protein
LFAVSTVAAQQHDHTTQQESAAHTPDCSCAVHKFAKRLQVHGYAIYKNGEYAAVRYPTEGYSADVAGRSFHHGRFVQKLRLRAATQQSITCREATVRRLINGEQEQLQQQRQHGHKGDRRTGHAAGQVSLARFPQRVPFTPGVQVPQSSRYTANAYAYYALRCACTRHRSHACVHCIKRLAPVMLPCRCRRGLVRGPACVRRQVQGS